MSKQFQLFLTPSDAKTLVEELRVRFDAKVLSQKSPTSDPLEMRSPIEHASIFRPGVTSIYCYLAPADGRIITDYYPTLGLWLTDIRSEAIEFHGCDFDGKTLLVGRFYFQTDELVDGRIVKKRAEFLKWADAIFRYTKKALRRERELGGLGAYVGKDAIIFRENGGKFASSIEGTGVRISPPDRSASHSRTVH